MKFPSLVLVLSAFLVGTATAATTDVTAQVVDRIHAELRQAQPHLGVPPNKAVNMLDGMLLQQYGAKGHLTSEPDAALKQGFYEAATLLMNGYPIAGGTLVSALRQTPAWQRSPSARALGAFVDAMLMPTDEDDSDLIAFQKRAKAIDAGLKALPFNIRFPAQVWLLGEIYHDAMAERAGQDVLKASAPTPAQQSQMQAARHAAAAVPVPEPATGLPEIP